MVEASRTTTSWSLPGIEEIVDRIFLVSGADSGLG